MGWFEEFFTGGFSAFWMGGVICFSLEEVEDCSGIFSEQVRQGSLLRFFEPTRVRKIFTGEFSPFWKCCRSWRCRRRVAGFGCWANGGCNVFAGKKLWICS